MIPFWFWFVFSLTKEFTPDGNPDNGRLETLEKTWVEGGGLKGTTCQTVESMKSRRVQAKPQL